MSRVMLILALLLAGCGDSMSDKHLCINGVLHRSWGGAWVLLDGRGVIGYPDGPIKCTDAPARGGTKPD